MMDDGLMWQGVGPGNAETFADCPQIIQIFSDSSMVPRRFPICNAHDDCLRIFSLAAIAYGLVITTFFTRAKTAATVGSILFYTTSFLTKRPRPFFPFPSSGRL